MERTRQILMEAIFEVFEKMLFVFLEPSDEPGSTFDMETVIRFDGGVIKGDIRMRFPVDVASAMAQNLLGLPANEVLPRHAEDCAKEAVNMIGGNFLSKFDSGRVFHLSIPEFSRRMDQKVPEGEGIYRLDFDSDRGKLSIVLTMSGQ